MILRANNKNGSNTCWWQPEIRREITTFCMYVQTPRFFYGEKLPTLTSAGFRPSTVWGNYTQNELVVKLEISFSPKKKIHTKQILRNLAGSTTLQESMLCLDSSVEWNQNIKVAKNSGKKTVFNTQLTQLWRKKTSHHTTEQNEEKTANLHGGFDHRQIPGFKSQTRQELTKQKLFQLSCSRKSGCCISWKTSDALSKTKKTHVQLQLWHYANSMDFFIVDSLVSSLSKTHQNCGGFSNSKHPSP